MPMPMLSDRRLTKNRRQHIAQKLSFTLIDALRDEGITYLTGRTSIAAEATRTLFMKLQFGELPLHDTLFPGRTYWLLKIKIYNCVRSLILQFELSQALLAHQQSDRNLISAEEFYPRRTYDRGPALFGGASTTKIPQMFRATNLFFILNAGLSRTPTYFRHRDRTRFAITASR
jgi:hypothetical protein